MNYRSFLFTTFVILIRLSCISQVYQNPPDYQHYRCQSAMTGCYKNFKEFDAGNPFVKSGFSMEKRIPLEVKDSRAGGYVIQFEAESYPDNNYTDKMWGVYCDDTLYINRKFFQGKKGFDKVYCLGSYGYFHGINPKGGSNSEADIFTSAFLFGLVGGLVAGTVDERNNNLYGKFPRVMIYLLDYETGLVSPLTRFKLEKILEADPKLSELYAREEHKSSMMIMHAYLDTFAERNRNK